jgi:uncharacterized protein
VVRHLTTAEFLLSARLRLSARLSAADTERPQPARAVMIGIHVAQLLLSAQGTARRYTFDEPGQALGEPNVVGRVHGEATLLRTGRGILADCEFETELSAECARCLEGAVVTVTGRFQEEFVPAVDVRTGAMIEDADETFRIGEDHVLDLGEAIRQHVLMAAPLQPLCRADCRGLCTQCGANLNHATCGCTPSPEASPFGALRTLLEQEEGQAHRA